MAANILDCVGKTPVISLNIDALPQVNVFAKLEYFNPTGSVKDRAADFILKQCLKDRIIDNDTVIIESSSGNFGIALSAYCRKNGLKFICVIDPNISPINEMIIRSFGGRLEKVRTLDKNGGYLLTRIDKVQELIKKYPNSYWINQYGNPLNAQAYSESLGREILEDVNDIDYVFLGVSSGGTITGVSQRLKAANPRIRVIAVDIYGSVVFGGTAMKRFIPGIGSSMRPAILQHARIDDVVMVSEVDTVKGCRELLSENFVFAGGSSGSAVAAIKKYFHLRSLPQEVNVLCIFPDRGERYFNTIYDDQWALSLSRNYKPEKSLA